MMVKNVSDDVQLSSGNGLPSVQLKFIKLFVFLKKIKSFRNMVIWTNLYTHPTYSIVNWSLTMAQVKMQSKFK